MTFKYLRNFLERLQQSDHVHMILLAVVIGLGGGLGAVVFRLCIRLFNMIAWQQASYTFEYVSGLPAWWKVLAPAIGGLFVGFITWRVAQETKGHGVPEVMEAIALRSGRIRPRVVLAKLIASGICIGSGGSVGREGPIVQIGSALGSTIGQWLNMDARRLRTLVGCGAAAGIAGTFNAPVAGALFAVEIILGDFAVTQFSPIVISSVGATVVSRYFLGDQPTFAVPGYSLVNPSELLAYVVLGILAGMTALAFIRSLYGVEDIFNWLPPGIQPYKTLLGGALIGVIGLWAPHIFGVGYSAISEALRGNIVWGLMFALVAAKILAVSITLGSGGSGGIFAPSLFIGAMLGGAIGTVVHTIWPIGTADAGAYALVGMGAVTAAATHAPLTAIIIIFEMTGDYKIILPLMISCIIATLLVMRLKRESIYTLKLLRRGIDIQKGKMINVLQHVPARDIMRPVEVTLPASSTLFSIISSSLDNPGSTLFVTNEEGFLEGIIATDHLRPVIQDAQSLGSLLIAEDLMVASGFPKITADESLAEVMKFLAGYRGEVPVLEDGILVGVIWPEDVIKRYNTEIFKRDMAGSMVSSVSRERGFETIPMASDAVVAEVPVPRLFIGRMIHELNIRQNFGTTVLMIKQQTEEGEGRLNTAPGPDYTFRKGDIMLILGPSSELPYLRSGMPRSGK